MNKGVLISVGVLVAVIVIAVLYTQGGYKGKISSTPTPAVREIMVEGSEYKFSPAAINLTAGETIKVTFKNMGKLPHNLTVAGLGVATNTISGGQQDSVTVTPDKSGMYTFFCSVDGHRQLGMEGKVEVK